MRNVFSGWWQVLVALVINGIGGASVYTAYSVIAVSLQDEFQPSRMLLMLGVTATSLVSGFISPFLGVAVDRYSMRGLLLVGLAFIAAGFFAMSFTSSMIQVLIVYAVFMSVSTSLLGPLATSALLARWFSRRRGLALGIAACGSGVGGLLIPPLIQYLIDSFDWRTALQIYSGITLVYAVPLVAFLVVNRPAERNLFPDGDSEELAKSRVPQVVPTVSTSILMRDFNFWLISITLGIAFAGPIALISNLVPYVVGMSIEASTGAFLLSIFSVASLFGKLLCGAIADRMGFRLGLGMILGLLSSGMFCFMQADSYASLVVASVWVGVSAGAVTPMWSVLLAHIYGPDSMGRVMGLMSLLFLPFTLFAAPLFGRVFDVTGSYDYAFIGYIILLTSSILLLPKLKSGPPSGHKELVSV